MKLKIVLLCLALILLVSIMGLSLAKQETVPMGPYDVSFDLGTVSHTVEVFTPNIGVPYIMEIHLPDNKLAEIWIEPADIPSVSAHIAAELESNSVNPEHNSTPVDKAHLINGMIDGLPGLVGSINLTDGSTFFEAEYRLQSRGNGESGRVSLISFTPYASTLINTIHVTESVGTKSSSTSVASASGWSVKVISGTSWSGSFGGDGNSRTVDGYGNKVISIADDPRTVVAVVQKKTESGSLKVQILKDGEIQNEGETTAAYGVVSVSS